MVDDPAADGWLTREQVEAHAAQLGLGGWRTVERYIKEGFVAGPRSPGKGRGQGRAYAYPARVLAQLDAVAAARGDARRPAPIRTIRHRLWWGGSRPDLFEAWKVDRLRWQWRFCKGWEEDRELAPAALADQVDGLANDWRRHRDWPYRGLARGGDRRRTVAAAIVALGLGRPTEVRMATDAVDVTRQVGEPGYLSVGVVVDHAMGVDRARRAGVTLPGEPGTWPRVIAGSIPPPHGWLWVLARLTEAEAARIRDRFTELDDHARARGFRVNRGEFRDQPELAGIIIATHGAWGWGAARVRPPEPAPCLQCGAGTMVSPDQVLAPCPHCGTWLTVSPDPAPAP